MPVGSGGKVLLAAWLAASVVGCPAPAEKTEEPVPSALPSSPRPSTGPTPVARETPPPSRGTGPMPMAHPRPEDGIPGTDRLRSMNLQFARTSLKAWIADTPSSRQLGLMHVKDLDEGGGMLFVYPVDARRAFWMENTYVPLSLAYLRSDGTIDQILDMEPLSRETHPSTGVIRLVLEVNQGWFDRHGVKVGDKIPGIEGLIGY